MEYKEKVALILDGFPVIQEKLAFIKKKLPETLLKDTEDVVKHPKKYGHIGLKSQDHCIQFMCIGYCEERYHLKPANEKCILEFIINMIKRFNEDLYDENSLCGDYYAILVIIKHIVDYYENNGRFD